MKQKGKVAIILGATGLTGSLLLQKLLLDDRYDCIKIFTRRPTGINHQKLVEIPANLLELEKYNSDFIADEVFCCVGTTAKKTPDKVMYKNIDYGIPVMAAKLCVKNQIPVFIVVSSIGANTKSKVFYSRTKGEMEQEVLKLNISKTYILQPSFIVGARKEKRTGEKVGIVIANLVKPLMFGPFKKYRAIQASTIANAIIYLANNNFPKRIVASDEIQELGKEI